MASQSLTAFHFWHKESLGEDKIHVYASTVLALYPDYQEHSKFLRIRNLESLILHLQEFDAKSTNPDMHQNYMTKINQRKREIYELENSWQFGRDKFFWNYARFLAVRKRWDEAAYVIERAIELHIDHGYVYSNMLNTIKEHHNFGKRDSWNAF